MSRTTLPRKPRIDFYPTPAWCVHRLLEAVDLPGGSWLEPCVGDGAIVRAVNDVRSDVSWSTIDVRPSTKADLIADFVALGYGDAIDSIQPKGGWDVIVTNPPFSLALEFVEEALRRSRVVAMLLRLGWLSSSKRHPFVSQNTPDVYVLPDRPSFDPQKKCGSDTADYGWMVWGPGRGGRIEILKTTPTERRAA